MKIGILVVGLTAQSLLPTFGSYSDRFVTLLKEQDANFEFDAFEVCNHQYPTGVDQCDAWLITGSKSNLDEQLPWMLWLSEFIVQINAQKRPLIGICFGHQIIADALGGKVACYEGGWGVGIHRYQFVGNDSLLPTHLASFAICAMHQYQVVAKPEPARVFARSDFCQYAGLLYDQHILTLQGHPEFNKAYEVALIEMLKDDFLSPALSEQGLLSLEQESLDADEVISWIVNFIKQAKPL
ncbi:glutamine amidotransferase-related protein [Marinomonas pollencensis]|uniref:GMP synthase-like glutamine amidotransferase n=1 Tax=Marinomonas pollencensis TaxID=491954 RepID=A0A3E0DX46_9GAMM|nr:glutamine amidotransferase [Marinomonas pollencensis]REG86661.1 GMP synthase-like glutamine amidotransferase [Marinomonas pollencensis]